jgi:hypothetical protein
MTMGAAVSRPGPDTTLTPELQRVIAGYVNAGATIPNAAEAAGVSWNTVKKWIAKGRKGIEPYDAFVAALAQARAMHSVAMQLVITNAAKKGDWRAAAWDKAQRDAQQRLRDRPDSASTPQAPAADLLEERTVLVYPVPVPEGASLADFQLPEGHVVETTGEDVTNQTTTVVFEDLDHDQ